MAARAAGPREGDSVTVDTVLSGLGIEATGAQRDALQRYLRELELWNRKRDLVKAEGDLLLTRHLADSLAGLPRVRRELAPASTPVLLDLGSGGGFPGMPLAVLLPEVRVVLVDRSRWKCSFLRSAAAVAGVANVRVVNAELGRLAGTEAAGTQAAGGGAAAAVPADLVVFRALAEVTEELASTLAGLLAPGGAVVAYKGKRAKAEAEARAAAKVFAEVSVEPVQVPGLGEERSLLVLRSARGSS